MELKRESEIYKQAETEIYKQREEKKVREREGGRPWAASLAAETRLHSDTERSLIWKLIIVLILSGMFTRR